jgi:hypothetical protein
MAYKLINVIFPVDISSIILLYLGNRHVWNVYWKHHGTNLIKYHGMLSYNEKILYTNNTYNLDIAHKILHTHVKILHEFNELFGISDSKKISFYALLKYIKARLDNNMKELSFGKNILALKIVNYDKPE